MFKMVMSECADWYIIPSERFEEWEDSVRYTFEGDEEWVHPIGDPSSISIIAYTSKT